jgi:hypothetical protein
LALCCAAPVRVQRLSASSETDLSGRWNDTDARMTSEALIRDLLAGNWLSRFRAAAGRSPNLRIRSIVNKTDEHIDAQVFVKNIEKVLIDGGLVQVLAEGGAELGAVAAEQQYGVSGAVSDENAPSIGNEIGADFVVAVRMTSVLDQIAGERTKLYKINLSLIGAESGEKVWLGDHEIKKHISQARARW